MHAYPLETRCFLAVQETDLSDDPWFKGSGGGGMDSGDGGGEDPMSWGDVVRGLGKFMSGDDDDDDGDD